MYYTMLCYTIPYYDQYKRRLHPGGAWLAKTRSMSYICSVGGAK